VAEIERALAAYLQAALFNEFDWRRRNCHSFAGDWILQIRGVDPGAAFRNRCSSPRGALRLIRRAGFRDLSECTIALMAAAAIAETDPAAVELGDIGIIMTVGLSDRPQQTLAIAATCGWAAPAPRGLLIAKAPALCAWSIRNA
jgi:hypothetical protein